VVTRDVSLADLASALDISVCAVRENLDRAAQRLEGIGFSLTDDGGRVRLFALPCAEAAVRTLSDVEEVVTPSAEQLEILAIVATSARPLARSSSATAGRSRRLS
jgi:chromosome segregation and condensation protein ScpB